MGSVVEVANGGDAEVSQVVTEFFQLLVSEYFLISIFLFAIRAACHGKRS
jgi:hypothetical protein